MEVDRTTDEPAPVPTKLPCPHVWTQLTPHHGAVSALSVHRAHAGRP